MPLNEGVRGGPQRGRRKSRSLCSRAMRRAGKVSPDIRVGSSGATVRGLPDERSKEAGEDGRHPKHLSVLSLS